MLVIMQKKKMEKTDLYKATTAAGRQP